MAKSVKTAAGKPAATKARAQSAGKAAAAAAEVSEARTKEFAAIQRQAKKLSASLTRDTIDADGNPTGAWKAMLDELDAWAKRHGVKFRTVERDPAGEAAGGTRTPRTRGACLGTHSVTERTDWVGGGHITIKTTCTFRRQTIITGRCVYSCVGEIVGFATS